MRPNGAAAPRRDAVLRLLAAIVGLAAATLVAALELIVLDVGQGTAVLVRAPDGRTALIDAGPASADVAARLRGLGVDRLDLVVASHAHADHIGGMPDVLRTFRPTWLLDNDLPHDTRTYERTLEAALEADVGLLAPERRTITLGDVELHVLPPPGVAAWGQNDNSVGVRVEYGAFSAVLPGDAEPDQWAWWLDRHGDLLGSVSVHLAAHHGSRNGDTAEALARLTPELVVVSAGRENRYGHPHPEALARYDRFAGSVLRTDRHGTVTIQAERDGSFEVTVERTPPAPDPSPEPAAPADAEPAPDRCVDLNRAPPERLTEIVHVGTDRAHAIVAARERAPFAAVDDLTRVSGIAAGRLADIRDEGLACVRP